MSLIKKLVDPRGMTKESIAQACDAVVGEWIELMSEPPDWMEKHLEERNIAEWVASASKNAWLMHDNCDANDLVSVVQHRLHLAVLGTHVEDENPGLSEYNLTTWFAIAHQCPNPFKSIEYKKTLVTFLAGNFMMTWNEIDKYEEFIEDLPVNGLEQACQRALIGMAQKIDPDKVSSVSDQQMSMIQLMAMSKEEIARRADEALKRLREKRDGDEKS